MTASILSQKESFHCKADAGVKEIVCKKTYCDHTITTRNVEGSAVVTKPYNLSLGLWIVDLSDSSCNHKMAFMGDTPANLSPTLVDANVGGKALYFGGSALIKWWMRSANVHSTFRNRISKLCN